MEEWSVDRYHMRAVAVAEGGSAENELTVQLDIVGACHQRRTCRDKMKGCDVKEPDPTFLEPRGAGTGVYTSGVRVSVVWFSCSTCMSTWRCARRRARGRESGSGSGLGWATSGRSVWIWKSTPRLFDETSSLRVKRETQTQTRPTRVGLISDETVDLHMDQYRSRTLEYQPGMPVSVVVRRNIFCLSARSFGNTPVS